MGYYKKSVSQENRYKRLRVEMLKEIKDSLCSNNGAMMLCGEDYFFIMTCKLPKKSTLKKSLILFIRDYFIKRERERCNQQL